MTRMKAVTLDTRPLATSVPHNEAQACFALRDLKTPRWRAVNDHSYRVTVRELSSGPSSQDTTVVDVDNCSDCQSPLLWGECMECTSNHTCQRGQTDCYPCQLALLETRVSSQPVSGGGNTATPGANENKFPWHKVTEETPDPRHDSPQQTPIPSYEEFGNEECPPSDLPPSPRQLTPSPSPTPSSEGFQSQIPYRRSSQVTPIPRLALPLPRAA